MRVATFNAHDSSRAVRRSLELAGLLLWQEFPTATPLPAAPLAGWELATSRVGTRTGVVTGWRLRWWDYLGSDWHQAHGGRRRVTPTRGTLVVQLRHRNGLKVAVVNGHRINRTRGAWLAVPGVHARWRADRWREHDALDRQLVAELLDSGVRVIVYGGDYNRRNVAPLHPSARRLTGAHIDQLWLIDLDGELRVGRTDAVHRLGSDHPLRRVRVHRRKEA